MLKIKRNYFFLVILFLTISSCNNEEIIRIEQEDIDFIESLEIKDKSAYLVKIDSVLEQEEIDEKRNALLLLKKGQLLSKFYKHEEAIEIFKSILVFFEKIKAKKQIAETYYSLGSANTFLKKKSIANEQLIKALEISQNLKDLEIEADIYSSIAHIYFLYKDFDNAINYTNKAINIIEKDSVKLSARYNNLAVIYRNIKDYKSALNYNIKSLEINIKLKDSASIAKSYHNLGLVTGNLGDLEKTIHYLHKSVEINKKIKSLNSSSLKSLGLFYLIEKNFSKSKEWYLKALEIENQKETYLDKKNIYNILLHIALQQKNFKDAINYQTKRDSFNSLQSKVDLDEKLNLVKNQYELTAKEKDLNQEKEINKRNRILFITITALLLLLSLLLFQRIKNKSLQNEKEKINLEQNVLRTQMNPHFIFNVLSAIQNSLLDNEPLKSATYLSQFAQLVRQNFDYVEKKTISLKEELDMLENYVATQKLRFQDKFDFELQVDEYIDTKEILIPPLFLQPFIENSIEHGLKGKKEKGLITVAIEKNRSHIQYLIEDNGKGFKKRKKDNKTHAIDIFLRRLKLLGNGDENTFSIKSSEKGTTVKFSIKL